MNHGSKHAKRNKLWIALLSVVSGAGVFFVSLVGFSAIWAFTTWGDLDIDEIIFQLKTPLEGTGNGMILDYVSKGLLPALAVLAVFILLILFLRKNRRRLVASLVTLVIAAVVFLLIQPGIWERLDMKNWLYGQIEDSDFIEKNYVVPASVSLTFPKKKRNLIHIYLESMETTFADEANGGAFPKNVIPELTEIAQEGEDFSGKDPALNGGIVFTGTGFTSGAIFARSTGLPLKLSIGANNMDTQTSFFSDVTALGDLLDRAGYRQVFLLGSDATFGGRRLFFEEHGNFEFRDYVYAKEQGWIDPDYMVWWGYEDEKLFRFAKETLSELSEGEEPFNLTILTVDTHFEDGYVCGLCGTEFQENQYANVMACSSRQVAEFLAWLKQQPFYENTTVVLTGDHTTMDTDFCENVSSEYQRKTYTAYLNAAEKPNKAGSRRTYSTFDDFPTILSALGVSIEGDRLGLGTNLFSSHKTLTEQYGVEAMRSELKRRSEFLERLEAVDRNSESLLNRYRELLRFALNVEEYDTASKQMQVRVNVNALTGLSVDQVEVVSRAYENGKTKSAVLTEDPSAKGSYIGTVDLSGWKRPVGQLSVNYYLKDGSVYKEITRVYLDYEIGDKSDFAAYFGALQSHPDYTVLLSVMDEGFAGLTEEMQESLHALGLKADFHGKTGSSYLAVIDAGKVQEQMDYEALNYESTLAKTGEPYVICSVGAGKEAAEHYDETVFDSDSLASIRINGTEYAVNLRGFNFVVYDNNTRQVIDAGCFDTH